MVVIKGAADIAVNSREPHLFGIATTVRNEVGIESVLLVVATLLVNGHCVPYVRDIDSLACEGPSSLFELCLPVEPSDKLDGVPGPEEVNLVPIETVRKGRVSEGLSEVVAELPVILLLPLLFFSFCFFFCLFVVVSFGRRSEGSFFV